MHEPRDHAIDKQGAGPAFRGLMFVCASAVSRIATRAWVEQQREAKERA